MNPAPNALYLDPPESCGVVWGGTDHDPAPPCNPVQPGQPQSSQLAPDVLPGPPRPSRASLEEGLCTPPSNAPQPALVPTLRS